MEPLTVRPVGRWSLIWRFAVGLAGIGLLLTGSLRMHDDAWPFAPMSQYAFAPTGDETIVITRVEGRLADGSRIDLALRPSVTGTRRADIEARRTEIIADPALLDIVVDGWTVRHPDRPRVEQVWLVQDRTTLVHGVETTTDLITLASWVVR